MSYKYHIFICTNERAPGSSRKSCRGTGLRDKFKEILTKHRVSPMAVRANQAGCLDQCESGPSVVVYPEGIWYKGVTEADVEEIVTSHIIGGVPVARLQ